MKLLMYSQTIWTQSTVYTLICITKHQNIHKGFINLEYHLHVKITSLQCLSKHLVCALLTAVLVCVLYIHFSKHSASKCVCTFQNCVSWTYSQTLHCWKSTMDSPLPCRAAPKRLYSWFSSKRRRSIEVFPHANWCKFKSRVLRSSIPVLFSSVVCLLVWSSHDLTEVRTPVGVQRNVCVCSAYIKAPIYVLAGGSLGKKKGKVRCVRGLLELGGLALSVFLWSSCKKQSRVIGKRGGRRSGN